MRSIAILGGKGGTTKSASAHLICLGAFLHGVPAAYALTDPLRKVRGEGGGPMRFSTGGFPSSWR